MFNRIVITGLLALSLFGCAGTEEKKTSVVEEGNAEELYDKGSKHMGSKNYDLAIEVFDALESRYPFTPYAQQAQLEMAYAHYKLREPDIAIAQADDFLKLNPRHEHVDYAYYIKGLANFDRFDGMFDSLIKRDFSELDTNPIKQAFLDFKLLLTRFPNSKYSIDSEQRLIYLKNLLAKHELNVARYYASRGAYVAVANRCKYLLETYDGSDSIPEALVELGKAYRKMGLQDSYDDTLRVLELNYPHQVSRLKEG